MVRKLTRPCLRKLWCLKQTFLLKKTSIFTTYVLRHYNIDKNTQYRINEWLSNEYDTNTRCIIRDLIDSEKETDLVGSFYYELGFGTGGLRGVMGVGSNRMNEYTSG